MPKEVFKHTLKKCKKKSSIGLLATEGTLKTGVYNKFFDQSYKLINPNKDIQKNSVNKAIQLVKMGKVKEANKIIKKAINHLIEKKCKSQLKEYLEYLKTKDINIQDYFSIENVLFN